MRIPENEEVIRKAWGVVQRYASFKYDQAEATLKREMHGDGCGCPRCTQRAVDDFNWAQRFNNPYGFRPPIVYESKGKKIIPVHRPIEDNENKDNWWLDIGGNEDGES